MAVAALLLLGLVFARDASPSIKSAFINCRYNATTRALSITTGLFATVRRDGNKISTSEFLLEPPVRCRGGSPTVTNTDRISILTKNYSSVEILLSGGPFAPGATPDSDSTSEIEIVLRGRGRFWLRGGPGADHFRYMTAGNQTGLNLNAGPGDDDIDLLTPSPETRLVVDGGPGPDTIDAVSPVELDIMEAFGGRGNDTLIGRSVGGFGGSLLVGESGRDRIIGGPGPDTIYPDSGPDLVRAGGGADAILTQPDKRRDRIYCGAGDDRVHREGSHARRWRAVDPFDQLRSCERVKGRR